MGMRSALNACAAVLSIRESDLSSLMQMQVPMAYTQNLTHGAMPEPVCCTGRTRKHGVLCQCAELDLASRALEEVPW